MFYDKFHALCAAYGTPPTLVARNLGIGQSTVSMWKKQGTTPKYDSAKKIADYFEMSVDTLLSENETADSICLHIRETVSNQKEKLDNSENPPEQRIEKAILLLSDWGKVEAAKRIEELTEIPRYRKDFIQIVTETSECRQPSPGAPPAPDKGKDTPAAPEGPEGPQEGKEDG